jgi:hypothetical protein
VVAEEVVLPTNQLGQVLLVAQTAVAIQQVAPQPQTQVVAVVEQVAVLVLAVALVVQVTH